MPAFGSTSAAAPLAALIPDWKNPMRTLPAVLVTLMLAACGDNSTQPKTAGSVPLGSGSIPATGGFMTVNKPGDPLNGLTLSVPSGAFSAALNLTVTSSSNTSWPTANGIVPISPIVHIASNQGGYATLPITIKLPTRVPANTFPVIVMYDTTTHALEVLTTVAYDSETVVGLTTHLNTANLMQPRGSVANLIGATGGQTSWTHAARGGRANLVRGPVRAAVSGNYPANFAMGAYAIPLTVLNQDYDTGFRPGKNDWEFSVPAVALADSSISPLGGAALTEAWYFNAGASATPLNNRFSKIKNVPLSDSLGIIWTSQFTATQRIATDALLAALKATADLQADSLFTAEMNLAATFALIEQRQIRAAFAIVALTGANPVPVIVAGQLVKNRDTTTAGQYGWTTLVAYRASGSQIYVADPGAPGDSSSPWA